MRSGICNTDLEILQGYMGFEGILGHEFVGVVESVGPPRAAPLGGPGCAGRDADPADWVGRRVCADINVPCRDTVTCPVCAEGGDFARNHCPNRTVVGIQGRDGTFAQYIALPLRNLHVLPNDLPDERALFAEPLAAACRVIEQGLVRPDDRVAILGDGKLGLLCAEVMASRRYLGDVTALTYGDDFAAAERAKEATEAARAAGGSGDWEAASRRPAVFGRHPEKMALLGDAADSHASPPSPRHIAMYDVVLEATGNSDGLVAAESLCRPMGTVVLKTTCAQAGVGFNPTPFVIGEKRIVGSRCGPLWAAIHLLSEGYIGRSLSPKNLQGTEHGGGSPDYACGMTAETAVMTGTGDDGGSGSATMSDTGGDFGQVEGSESDGEGNLRDVGISEEFVLEKGGRRLRGVDPSKYITAVYPLVEIEKALQMARTRGTLKVQIVCC
ncbi:unnamed protein product [Phaeothamnion confervicola]